MTALRIVRKVPDLAENFLNSATNLLSERNHGVLMTAVTLLEELCKDHPEITNQLRSQVPRSHRVWSCFWTFENGYVSQ